jgi:pimeloyl-ACP methyl ester carboxylesterase
MSATTEALSYADVNGTRLAYREGGTGEPMVLVHGQISDHRTWTALEAKLSAYYHVYSYSRRFAWPNKPIADGEPQPWEQDAEDILAFIEALKIGPVHALGNSSGATTILLAAREKPHLFRTLLLEEPPLFTIFLPELQSSSVFSVLSFLVQHPISFYYMMYYTATNIVPATEMAKKGDDEKAIMKFGYGVLGPKYWHRARADIERRRQIEDNSKTMCNFFRYNLPPKYTAEDARKIRIPTLLLTGAEGPYHQQCIDAELIKCCGAKKKAEAIIAGAGHLMHEDNPEGVLKVILEFMRELK